MKHTLSIIALLFLLGGCAPIMTYEEMGDAYETAATPEEKKIAEKRLNTFEANVVKADAYYESRDACERSDNYIWYCSNSLTADLSRVKSLGGKVRAWKRERGYCGCALRAEVMRNLF